jgi:hypothetical protein
MTSTDQLAAPVVELGPLSEQEARELTRQIAQTLAVAWDKIVEAYQRRVWEPLGYDSWDSYCRAELGSTRLRLPAEEREQAVRSLRSAGLSTRAIAAATGQSDRTVRRDLAGAANAAPAGASDETPGDCVSPHPASVTGLDGKSYPSTQAPVPDAGEPIDAEVVEDDSEPAGSRAAGSSRVSGSVRRRPLPEAAKEAGWAIRRATERVVRIVGDDRLPANKQQVSAALRSHLLFVAQAVDAALGELSDHNNQ